MEMDCCEDCLVCLKNNGVTELSIYWMEDIKDGDDDWWVDVCEDQIDQICGFRWVWSVISKVTVDREIDENLTNYGDDEDDCVVVVDALFSEEVIKQTIEGWLKEKGLVFDVKVIGPEGTDEASHLLSVLSGCDDI